jgi:putative transposase
MPQSLSSILVHLVFSTKHREPFITKEIEGRVHGYLVEVFHAQKSPSLIVGGVEDQIHVLFSLSRVITVADLVEEVKKNSSKWIKTLGPQFSGFQWQAGYGAFSISQSGVGTAKRYIAGQRERHRSQGFKDEFRDLLRKYEIPFDERYVWD